MQEPKASSAAPVGGARLSPAAIPIWFLYESPRIAAGLIPMLFLGPVALVAIAIGGIGLAVPVIRYLRFTYLIEGDSLIVEGGLLSRWRRVIPRAKIQSIDSVQKLRHKLFGVVELRIEVAGGGKTEAELVALDREEANRIRAWASGEEPTDAPTDAAAAAGPPPFARMTTKDLLIAGVTGGRIAVFAILIGYAQQIAGDQLFERFSEQVFNRAVSEGAPFLIVVALTVMLVLIVTLTMSLVATVLTYWNFTLRKEGTRLVITRGLLESRRSTVPLARIQALEINENLLRRVFGMASITAVVAGYSGPKEEASETSVVLPIGKRQRAGELAADILGLPAEVANERLIPATRRALGRRMIRALAVGKILTGIILLTAWGIDRIEPATPTGWLRIVALFPIPLICAIGFAGWRSLGHRVNERCAIVRSGVAVRKTSIVPRPNVQHLTLHRSPFQTPWNLATLNLHIPKSTKKAEDVPEQVAQTLFADLSN